MEPSPSPPHPPGPKPLAMEGLKVALDLGALVEHCRCSICMGIIKNTRAVSACMHRFCKECIEAWLRTQIENNCPTCRVKFSSKRDCKPDPIFDLLLRTMFGDVEEFEQQMLEPSREVLGQAMAVGQHLAVQAKEQAALRPASPPRNTSPYIDSEEEEEQQHGLGRVRSYDATVRVTAVQPRWQGASTAAAAGTARQQNAAAQAGKRQAGSAGGSDAKKQRMASPVESEDGNFALQYRGVRFQGDKWQARTKRNGKEITLGLYNTGEEAGMAYDIDRLQQQGGKAQRLNFPLLRQRYKHILDDVTDQKVAGGLLDFLAVAVKAAVKAARAVPEALAPENTGPAAASKLNARQSKAAARRQRHNIDPDFLGGSDSDSDNVWPSPAPAPAPPPVVLDPLQQHLAARQQAEQLAKERSLAAGLVDGVAHVRLEAGSGPSWQMTYLACPVSATIGQVSEVVALGISQQHALQPGGLRVGLAVTNKLDASADLNTLCSEDDTAGKLLLRSHVTIRELLGSMQASLETLCLACHSALCQPEDLGRSSGGDLSLTPHALGEGIAA